MMKSKLMIVGLLIAMSLLLSGCFFSEQTLVIGPDGKADIKVELWFDEIQAGDQGCDAKGSQKKRSVRKKDSKS